MVLANTKTQEFAVMAENGTKTIVKPTQYTKLFVGAGPPKGNSVLVALGDNKYMFVGHEVFVFGTKESIVSYASPVGNSDVPYPYAVDANKKIYLMLEKVAFPWTFGTDPYEVYYATTSRRMRLRSKIRFPKLELELMKTKLVHKRLF